VNVEPMLIGYERMMLECEKNTRNMIRPLPNHEIRSSKIGFCTKTP
jgi:hypothetical protein